jgi:ubiquitin-like protein Pup
MADQQKQTSPSPAERDQASPAPAATKKDSALAEGLDDLLDEIDEVLETNAEEFVKSYVQKGGE